MKVNIYTQICQAALDRDAPLIRECLETGINPFQARYFFERAYNDPEGAELIRKQTYCECGMRAIKFKPVPICGQCSFKKGIESIQFGKVTEEIKIAKNTIVDLILNSINTVEVWVFDIVGNIAIVGNRNFPAESFPVELSRLKLLIPENID